MLKTLKKVASLLDNNQKKKTFTVQFLNVLASLLEVLTLSVLAIFIASLSQIKNLSENQYLNFFYNFFDFKSEYDYLFFLGLVILLLYIFTGLFNIFITWKTNLLASTISQNFTNLVIKNYVYKNWNEFTKLKISNINKEVFTDLYIVSNSIVYPIFNLFNKIFIASSISLILIIYNFKVAVSGIIIYSTIYFILFSVVKKITTKTTQEISANRKKNHAFIHNFFSGFKEVVIFNLKNLYFEKIKRNNQEMILPVSLLNSLSQIPRFFIELVTYTAIITGILLVINSGKNLESLLPLIAIYAFAGLKLLPAFQQIYLAYVRIKSGQVALDNIYPKIQSARKIKELPYEKTNQRFKFNKNITLKNIFFRYDSNSKKPSLKNINLNIKKNSIIGIAGPSGGGKSTIVDIICGLLEPSKGQILVDGKKLSKNKLRLWQNNFGVVTQMPFLSGTKISDNISFGNIKRNFDKKKIIRIIKKVELSNFIKKQKKGINSDISDRGVNISGGERQRIAIARSLYFDNDIIIFDEATNALDKITENKIINYIKRLKDTKTIIIITHRTSTLKICDYIYLIKEGSITGSGKYDSLKKKNSLFKKLIVND